MRGVLGLFGVALLVPGLVQAMLTGTIVARLIVIAATGFMFFRQHARTRFRWRPVLATALAAGAALAPFQVGLGSRTLPYAIALAVTGVGAMLILAAWFHE